MPVGRGLKNSGPARALETVAGTAKRRHRSRRSKAQETSHVAECLGALKHHAAAAQKPHALSAWGFHEAAPVVGAIVLCVLCVCVGREVGVGSLLQRHAWQPWKPEWLFQ